ncbi:hypothetical protein NDU88_002458 [Pleurodeles waltl]|uniref:Uncharacterized protein n=1 Tax=Pleurodeles waltl TaxID=8319 RepID=A0AAV7T2F0_PLEWA|nr:hypothetical protein NDU88_002458 [Pleurodeles waltl]
MSGGDPGSGSRSGGGKHTGPRRVVRPRQRPLLEPRRGRSGSFARIVPALLLQIRGLRRGGASRFLSESAHLN